MADIDIEALKLAHKPNVGKLHMNCVACYEAWPCRMSQVLDAYEAAQARTALAEAERERDLAVAHDSQPYPTAWAYEQAASALEHWRERAEKAEANADTLRQIANDYGAEAHYRPTWREDRQDGANGNADLHRIDERWINAKAEHAAAVAARGDQP